MDYYKEAILAGVPEENILEWMVQREETAAAASSTRGGGGRSEIGKDIVPMDEVPQHIAEHIESLRNIKKWRADVNKKEAPMIGKSKKASKLVCDWLVSRSTGSALNEGGYTFSPYVSTGKTRYSEELILKAYKQVRNRYGQNPDILAGASYLFNTIEQMRREAAPEYKLSITKTKKKSLIENLVMQPPSPSPHNNNNYNNRPPIPSPVPWATGGYSQHYPGGGNHSNPPTPTITSLEGSARWERSGKMMGNNNSRPEEAIMYEDVLGREHENTRPRSHSLANTTTSVASNQPQHKAKSTVSVAPPPSSNGVSRKPGKKRSANEMN